MPSTSPREDRLVVERRGPEDPELLLEGGDERERRLPDPMGGGFFPGVPPVLAVFGVGVPSPRRGPAVAALGWCVSEPGVAGPAGAGALGNGAAGDRDFR